MQPPTEEQVYEALAATAKILQSLLDKQKDAAGIQELQQAINTFNAMKDYARQRAQGGSGT